MNFVTVALAVWPSKQRDVPAAVTDAAVAVRCVDGRIAPLREHAVKLAG